MPDTGNREVIACQIQDTEAIAPRTRDIEVPLGMSMTKNDPENGEFPRTR